MTTKSIGFIGGGRITHIFLQGFKNANEKFHSVKVYDINSDTLAELKNKFKEIEPVHTIAEAAKQDIVFIALHPPVIGEVVGKAKTDIGNHSVVISLAPKITIEKLFAITGIKKIVRIIPNATSYINKGYNPVCFSDSFDNDEKMSILDILQGLGKTFETKESTLEAYAISSAMLPTYFWFQWHEMESIASEIGLSEQESRETIYETLKASLELMYQAHLDYKSVTDLIPLKPIADNEPDIKNMLRDKLIPLYEKIKP